MDANTMKRIQQKFSVLCFNRFFPEVALEQLNLHIQQKTRYHLDAFFLTQAYRGSRFCFPVRVPARYIRDFSTFNVCSSSKDGYSSRWASAANVVS
jgi:hypothetical protein